jgi:predicted anti-sigma-YlaC factor YlaD
MKCRNVQKKFSAYQDGELKPREQEEVNVHLLNCRSCREQYAEIERIWQTLGESEEIRPDPWFYSQIVRKMKEPREQVLLPVLQHVFQVLRAPAIASGLVAVGILVGIYIGSVMVQFDFLPFRQTPAGYSQEAFLDTLRVFDSAPPGTLAHGYMQMAGYKGDESK